MSTGGFVSTLPGISPMMASGVPLGPYRLPALVQNIGYHERIGGTLTPFEIKVVQGKVSGVRRLFLV